ncbi:hypothetical protein NDA01_08315 [Trichocoleus desertorum AS-A10]|uniref:hypothetical protein n=1 Tax=Trichocoleus desertorum TaxID=1481672 RepID=UPI0032978B3F
MVKLYSGIESKPSLVALNQIEVPQDIFSTSSVAIEKVANTLKRQGFNWILPIVCLTENEDQYRLMTGSSIYRAAVQSEVERIWVFLIAAQRLEVEAFLEDILAQLQLNTEIIELQDIDSFLEFINHRESKLTLIPGIKDKYAKLIVENRPYSSKEDMQKKLGIKRSLNWVKSYKKIKAR